MEALERGSVQTAAEYYRKVSCAREQLSPRPEDIASMNTKQAKFFLHDLITHFEKTGVKTDERGFVIADEYLETNVKGIFALGDVLGHYLFRDSANLESEYDFYNMLDPGRKVPVDYAAMPHAIFTSPQVAGVGKTEQELRSEKVDYYFVGRYEYIDTAMGKAIEDGSGFVKILADRKTKRVLGCHIMGSDASTLIHESWWQ